ncbi:MAG: hypothetical protein FD174_3152 [Geobacteraceae bacterium]|nr:MAG: hypothetical protein FD174_3152 [Geobacteraceae bacterium]
MKIFESIAEQRIREAMDRGEFDNLAGKGLPLKEEDLSGVPEELRMAYKVLKNAGCVPPEVELRKEIVNLRDLVGTIEEDREKRQKLKELNFKLLKLNMLRKRPFNLDDFPEYQARIVEKVTG